VKELRLKFSDPSGEREVAVTGDRFVIGRHSASDLAVADGRLSREHAVIERSGDEWFIDDKGSSNGTDLNDEPVFERTRLSDGDRLSLGGFRIAVSIVSKTENTAPAQTAAQPASVQPSTFAIPATGPQVADGIPKIVFFVAPGAALLVLLIVVGVLYIGGRGDGAQGNDIAYSDDPTPRPTRQKENNDDPPSANNTNSGSTAGDPGNSGSGGNSTTVPTPSTNISDTSKVEQNGAAFLRKAAQNDPRAFLTGEQASIVAAKIRSMSGSIGDNLASAKRNAAAIRTLATSKNLKPDLLAAAALAKLGTSRGDVLATANSMVATLDRLSIQVGNELGEDCLLMMAAYDQGEAGDFLKMRNMLQDLATKATAPVREIRTIWYLKKQGKITDGEYDLALRFLAAGTIMQNPKDFGVNAEATAF